MNVLSTNQYYGYEFCSVIRRLLLPGKLEYLKICIVSHSRWLPTALRFCRIWGNLHNIKGMHLNNITLIVQFVVEVYLPHWFNIKVKYIFLEYPRYIIYPVNSDKDSCSDSRECCKKTNLLCSYAEDTMRLTWREERFAAKKKILDAISLRGSTYDESIGEASFRVRITHEVNIEAKVLNDLINLNDVK